MIPNFKSKTSFKNVFKSRWGATVYVYGYQGNVRVAYPPWVRPKNKDAIKKLGLPNQLSIREYADDNAITLNKAYRDIPRLFQEAYGEQVKVILRPTIPSHVNREQYTKPVPVALLNKPFGEIISQLILDGKPLDSFKKYFTKGSLQYFTVSYKSMKWYVLDSRVHVQVARPSTNVFGDLGKIQHAIDEGRIQIVQDVAYTIPARTFEEFKAGILSARSDVMTRVSNRITSSSSEYEYVSLLPDKVEPVRDIRHALMFRSTAHLRMVDLTTCELPMDDSNYCVMRGIGEIWHESADWKVKNEHGIYFTVWDGFSKITDVEQGISIDHIKQWASQYPVKIVFYAPDGSIIERAGNDSKWKVLHILTNNDHMYVIDDTHFSRSVGQKAFTNSLPKFNIAMCGGDMHVIHENDIEEMETKKNYIVGCKNPDKACGTYAMTLINETNIGSVPMHNSLIINDHAVVFTSDDIVQRRDFASHVRHNIGGDDAFNVNLYPNPSWRYIGEQVFKHYAGGSLALSNMNKMLRDQVDRHAPGPAVHTLRDVEECENSTAIDISGAYRNVCIDNTEPWMVFNKMCYTEAFVQQKILEPGYYWIQPYKVAGISFENNITIATVALVRHLLAKGYINQSDIIMYARPASLINHQLLKETMEFVMSTDATYTNKKMVCNALIGGFGTKTAKEYLYFTTTNEELAKSTQLLEWERDHTVKSRINQYGKYFFGEIIKSRRLERDSRPIYHQVLCQARLKLIETMEYVLEHNAFIEVVGWKTDSVIVVNKIEQNLDIPKWTTIKKNELPNPAHSYIYEEDNEIKPMTELIAPWKNTTLDEAFGNKQGVCVIGEAGSGKTTQIRKYITDEYLPLTTTHSSKINLHPNAKTIASQTWMGKKIRSNVIVDEFCVMGETNLCSFVDSWDNGFTVAFCGDPKQGLPFDGNYIDLMNHPVIRMICDSNLVDMPYNSEYGRYDDAYHKKLQTLITTGMLPNFTIKSADMSHQIGHKDNQNVQVITKFVNYNDAHETINKLHGYTLMEGSKIRLRSLLYIKQDETLCNGFEGTAERIEGGEVWMKSSSVPIKIEHVELAHCITTIRAQGITYNKPTLVYDIGRMETLNEVYVATSRNRKLGQLIVVGNEWELRNKKWEWAKEDKTLKIYELKPITSVLTYMGYNVLTDSPDYIKTVIDARARANVGINYRRAVERIERSLCVNTKDRKYKIKKHGKAWGIFELKGKSYGKNPIHLARCVGISSEDAKKKMQMKMCELSSTGADHLIIPNDIHRCVTEDDLPRDY